MWCGLKWRAIVRSYLSSLRKQSIDTYHALVTTFQGNPRWRASLSFSFTG
jgi:hypothetical protein